jgi:hypothetical protein
MFTCIYFFNFNNKKILIKFVELKQNSYLIFLFLLLFFVIFQKKGEMELYANEGLTCDDISYQVFFFILF